MQSKSLEVDDGSRTLRIGPIIKDCPIDMIEQNPSSTSFLQITSDTKSLVPPQQIFKRPETRKLEASIQPHDHERETGRMKDDNIDYTKVSFLQISESPMKLGEPVGKSDHLTEVICYVC